MLYTKEDYAFGLEDEERLRYELRTKIIENISNPDFDIVEALHVLSKKAFYIGQCELIRYLTPEELKTVQEHNQDNPFFKEYQEEEK